MPNLTVYPLNVVIGIFLVVFGVWSAVGWLRFRRWLDEGVLLELQLRYYRRLLAQSEQEQKDPRG